MLLCTNISFSYDIRFTTYVNNMFLSNNCEFGMCWCSRNSRNAFLTRGNGLIMAAIALIYFVF